MSKPDRSNLDADAPHSNQAYQRLIDGLQTGKLNPGERLVETDIAVAFNVSRTPVREALRRLEADGLVTHTPRQGASVRRLDHAEIVELYEMRSVLEGASARFAAYATTEAELDVLEELNQKLSVANTAQKAFLINQQFHALLLASAKNRYLIRSNSTLQKTLLLLGGTTLDESTRVETAVNEHRAILEAIRTRDGDTAEVAMRAHIEASHRARLKAIQDTAQREP